MKKSSSSRLNIWITVSCITAMVLVLFMIGVAYKVESERSDAALIADTNILDVSRYWLYTDGEKSEWIELPFSSQTGEETVSLERTLTSRSDMDVLLFNLNRMHYEVYIDDIPVYQQNETLLSQSLMIKDYGIIDFPCEGEHQVKVLIYTPDHEITFDTAFTGNKLQMARYLLESDGSSIAAMVILVFLAILLLVILIIFFFFHLKEARFGSLLFFLMATLLWAFFDSSVTVLTGISTEVCSFISYFAFMVMPIPLLFYAWYSLGEKLSSLQIMILVCFGNIIVQAVLSLANIATLNELLPLTHVILFSSVVLGLYNSWKNGVQSEKEEKSRKRFILLFIAFLELLIDAILAAILFWADNVNGYRTVLLTGIVIYFGILLTYTFTSFLQAYEEAKMTIIEKEAYVRLALFDELTGLGNRRMFEEELKSIDELPEDQDAILIMIDMNDLKSTNDRFGHNTGDSLIVAAAQVIATVFGEKGRAFRIGGDEFVVLITEDIDLDSYLDDLESSMEVYNISAVCRLSMAIGYSHRLNSVGKSRSLVEWKEAADIQMYINKASNNTSKRKERDQDLQRIINYIVATVEAKDPYTAQHSERVRRMSVVIGKALGLSADSLEELDIAAHVHDIGKIGVPDEILFKPGSLTEEERVKIQEHASIGCRIVANGSFGEVPDIILHHHERYDGKGYPDGLSGTDIPLCSRIIAIADSIDAMTSRRVYREGLSIDFCKEEIEQNLGILYDPAIGRIALQNWDSLVEIIKTHPMSLSDK